MSDRTYGETKDCRGCRYWSEMIAQSIGFGPVQALCLVQEGPLKGRYVSGRQTCSAWADGYLGAVDTPGFDGTEYDAPTSTRSGLRA